MVNLIMGLEGSGKTKKLVELVCGAVNEGSGDVVVIEKERKLTYDVPYQARLVDASAYGIGSYELLKGFISGIHAGNYDITHFFVDNFFKIVEDKSPDALVEFVDWLDRFSTAEKVDFIISASAEADSLPASLKAKLI